MNQRCSPEYNFYPEMPPFTISPGGARRSILSLGRAAVSLCF